MAGDFVSVTTSTSDYIGPTKSATDSVFNSSGWTVATSGSKASGTSGGMPQWVTYAAIGLLVLVLLKKRKG